MHRELELLASLSQFTVSGGHKQRATCTHAYEVSANDVGQSGHEAGMAIPGCRVPMTITQGNGMLLRVLLIFPSDVVRVFENNDYIN